MNLDWFETGARNPLDDLPGERLERAIALKNGLLSLCEGGSRMNDLVYRTLRREFMADPDIAGLVPQFVRTCQDTGAVWAFLKDQAAQWEPRRVFVREQFRPLIDKLEAASSPLAEAVSTALTVLNAESVSDAWAKALARREADPAGAITAARTLLEAVCKHVLEDENGSPEYGEADDLPKLYRAAAEKLNLAPSQHTEDAFRRILGGATSVVEGLGSLRNKVGDAHGQGRRPIKPAVRHAGLAVNMAGSMALFLIETVETRSN